MDQTSTTYQAIYQLRRLPPTLLLEFLRLLDGPLRAVGLDPGALDAHGLWGAQERLPELVLEAIYELHRMTDDVGHDHLVTVAHRHGQTLPIGVLPLVLAARVRVEQPSLFVEATARRSIEPMRPFRELVGRRIAAPTWTAGELRHTEDELAECFERRGWGRHCHIEPWRDHDLHYFLVRHAMCCRAEHELQGDQVVTRERWPVGHDLVALDTRTGHLRLGARDEAVRATYRAAFGGLLFQDPDWFQVGPVISLEPLVVAPMTALLPTLGIRRVRLVEIELAHQGKRPVIHTLRGEDALGAIHDLGLTGGPRAARFELQHLADDSWHSVAVAVPNRISGEWWADDLLARRFLEERRILAGPRRAAA